MAAFACSAFGLATTALTGTAHATSPCAALSSTFPHGEALTLSQAIGYRGANTGTPVVLTLTGTDVAAGVISASPQSPAACKVDMVIASDGNAADSQIQVETVLPVQTEGDNDTIAWNGRFLGTGNGGFAGAISTGAIALGLAPDYAASGKTYVVANTDMGVGAGLGGPPNWATPWYNCNTLFCGSNRGQSDLRPAHRRPVRQRHRDRRFRLCQHPSDDHRVETTDQGFLRRPGQLQLFPRLLHRRPGSPDGSATFPHRL